jgi:endonuclease/exonuclease/phosphatase family metal-dependent hydrolase
MKLRLTFLIILLVSYNFHTYSQKELVETKSGTEIKILCWNIYMLPVVNKGQWGRVNHIEKHLKQNHYDVIVLQEVFLERIKKQLIKSLTEEYPYYAGPPGKDFGLFGQDGGVMIFSKHPILKTDIIKFEDGCKGADCLAQKGAVFVEIQKGNQTFQVIGTHLQSMQSNECQKIRDRQMCTIYTDLLQKHQKPLVPQFIVGDLNTECHIPQRYIRMLALLDAKDSANSRNFKTISTQNKFNSNPNDEATLDYILYRANQSLLRIKHSFVKIFKGRWSDDNDDLSDHYAVEAIFEILNPNTSSQD